MFRSVRQAMQEGVQAVGRGARTLCVKAVRSKKLFTLAVVGTVCAFGLVSAVRADAPTVTPIDLATVGFAGFVNWTTAGVAIASAAVGALGVAFFVGGGSRIAKKGFSWAFNKL